MRIGRTREKLMVIGLVMNFQKVNQVRTPNPLNPEDGARREIASSVNAVEDDMVIPYSAGGAVTR